MRKAATKFERDAPSETVADDDRPIEPQPLALPRDILGEASHR